MATWRVKFDGPCSKCGVLLPRGAPAIWDRTSRTMRCIECPPVDAPSTNLEIDRGIAGQSARAEYGRRVAKHDAAIVERWGSGFTGRVVRAIASEPHTTRAWAVGAAGEEKLALELETISSVQVLNDRRVPGSKANIDHIVIAPAGVFVVDAKNHKGTVEIRNRGGLLRGDYRLIVGGRDCSAMADNMALQIEAVAAALAQVEPKPQLTPVLCFLQAEWPLIRRANEFRGVRLESHRSLKRLLTREPRLDSARVLEISASIAASLPAR